MEDVCLVGFALNNKKLRPSESQSESAASPGPWCGGGLADILGDNCSAALDGVQFLAWDPKVSAAKQPKFNVLVHKLTEDLSRSETTDKIVALEEYLASNPGTFIVDKLSAVRCVVSRALTCHALERIRERKRRAAAPCPASASSFHLSQPKFFVCDTRCSDEDSQSSSSSSTSSTRFSALVDRLLELMRERGMSFPVICKPVQGCGTPNSHHMVVVVAEEGLNFLLKKEQQWLVQQYHNHDSCFYKVYVIDTDVMIHTRPSLPNLEPYFDNHRGVEEAGAAVSTHPGIRSVEFDSRYAYPTIDDFLLAGDDKQGPTSQNPLLLEPRPSSPPSSSSSPLPDGLGTPLERGGKGSREPRGALTEQMLHSLRAAALDIREEFGLSLFGFDVIVPTSSVGNVPGGDDKDGGNGGGGEGRGGEVGTSSLLVVDVNFFPSYKEVTDFPQRFRRYLRRAGGFDTTSNESNAN